ncbi:hypothetical protein C1645_873349 [Glomus cerebriforme]|uniref:Uncharacterized protein n=1 Tax=Glomus cerebriforme TaxID=658196 RepID=A0A397T9S2_9GLOM|nr:hypothetical protein C1645_873349 [Glomus cerebriforme]
MSLTNLKTLTYNILKILEDASVRDMEVPELAPCLEYYVSKKTLPDILNICPFPKCAKTIETGGMSTRRDSESSQSSGTSAISNLFDDSFTLNLPTIGQDMDELSTDVPRIVEVREREALQRESI